MVLKHSTTARPRTVGATHTVRVEVTEPIPDILPPAPVERLECAVALEGISLGTLELPVCDGFMPGYVLADAIAAEFAWPILGHFFERTVYRDLRIEQGPSGLSVWRGTLLLADELLGDDGMFAWRWAHTQFGWAACLQAICGCRTWPRVGFSDPRP